MNLAALISKIPLISKIADAFIDRFKTLSPKQRLISLAVIPPSLWGMLILIERYGEDNVMSAIKLLAAAFGIVV